VDADGRELAAVARALDAAEGQARVGGDEGVDRHGAGVDAAGEGVGALGVGAPDGRAEAVAGVVGELDGVVSTLFFSAAPAAAATNAPARSEPVSVTAATRGSAISLALTSGTLPAATIRLVKTPSGAPACRKTSSSAIAVPETFGACLSSAVLPARIAGAAKRITCQSGKFHGMTAKITPIGS
jgi:hypothetical protein